MQVFNKLRLPYRIVGGVRFFERLEVSVLMAYLRLVNNPNDDLSLEVAITHPRRRFASKSIEQLRNVRVKA